MSFINKFIAPFQKGLRYSVSSFIQLETSDNETTLAASDGSLVSYLRIEGSRQLIGEEEFEKIIEGATIKIGARFDRPGHALQIFFVRDPNRIDKVLKTHLRPARTTARNCGLDLEDMFDEKAKHLSRFMTHEEFYFVLWTRPSVLTKTELERSAREAKDKTTQWVPAGFAQFPMAGLEPLRSRHKTYVSAIHSALDELGIRAHLMEVHDALNAIRGNIFPDRANEKWRACLPGDPIPARAPMSTSDMSDLLWPPLPTQLTAGDARLVTPSVVKIGNLLWAGADMTLGPMEATAFPVLMNRLVDADMPFRISFLIEGGGAYATQFRSFLATVMGVTNATNKQIKFSLEGLTNLARSEPVVRFRCSLATWCRQEEKSEILDRLSVLMQAVESWGYCQVSEFSGDPLDCVMSSAMGIHCGGTGVPAIAPLKEVCACCRGIVRQARLSKDQCYFEHLTVKSGPIKPAQT